MYTSDLKGGEMNEETKNAIGQVYETTETPRNEHNVCTGTPAFDASPTRHDGLFGNTIINCNHCGKQQIVVVPYSVTDQFSMVRRCADIAKELSEPIIDAGYGAGVKDGAYDVYNKICEEFPFAKDEEDEEDEVI
jgi:hypothetical protein